MGRDLTEPGLGVPPRGAAAPPERGARRLVAIAALALLILAAWTVWMARPVAVATPGWKDLAPPPDVPIRPWRWLVFRTGGRDGAHFAVVPTPGGDPARLERLPGWTLQWPAPGYPQDAIVVAVSAPTSDPAVERRLAELAAILLVRIPSLSLQRTGLDRTSPPSGIDQERLRYGIHEAMEQQGSATR